MVTVSLRPYHKGLTLEDRCLYGEPPFDYGKVCGWLSNGMAGDRK